jgi:hypothetical protein
MSEESVLVKSILEASSDSEINGILGIKLYKAADAKIKQGFKVFIDHPNIDTETKRLFAKYRKAEEQSDLLAVSRRSYERFTPKLKEFLKNTLDPLFYNFLFICKSEFDEHHEFIETELIKNLDSEVYLMLYKRYKYYKMIEIRPDKLNNQTKDDMSQISIIKLYSRGEPND